MTLHCTKSRWKVHVSFKNDCFLSSWSQGRLRVPRAGGQGFHLGHINVHICSSTAADFRLQALLQKNKCLVYWSPSRAMVIRGSGDLPPEKCSCIKLSTTPKNAHSQDKRDGKSSV